MKSPVLEEVEVGTAPLRSCVSVVVPHAGNRTHLERCLESVTEEAAVAETIVVMPDGMEDSVGIARSVAGVRCILTPKLLGYGPAANRGLAEATQPLVLVLNDDAWVTPGAVNNLAAWMTAHESVGACGAPFVFPDGRRQPSVFADVGVRSAVEAALAPLLKGVLARLRRHPRADFPDHAADVDWLSGAGILVRRSAFTGVGGFDEGFAHGFEDADLCRKLRGAGRRVVAVPGPPVVHAKGGSGYRSADVDRVRRALTGGVEGWRRYSRRYHGTFSRKLQRLALVAFVVSRVGYFELRRRGGKDELGPLVAAYKAAGRQLLRDGW
jgi:GT2 family glycosyltransferase